MHACKYFPQSYTNHAHMQELKESTEVKKRKDGHPS